MRGVVSRVHKNYIISAHGVPVSCICANPSPDDLNFISFKKTGLCSQFWAFLKGEQKTLISEIFIRKVKSESEILFSQFDS